MGLTRGLAGGIWMRQIPLVCEAGGLFPCFSKGYDGESK